MLAFAAALSYVAFRLGIRLYDEAISLAALPAVESLAHELSEQVIDRDPAWGFSTPAKIQDLFPGISFYIIQFDGTVVAQIGQVFDGEAPKVKINPAPIKAFLSSRDRWRVPAYCEMPGSTKQDTIFVAAPVRLDSGDHILLAVLNSYVARAHVIYNLDEFVVPYVGFLVLGFILLSLGTNAALQRRLTRRLRKLIEVVSNYMQGNYKQRIELAGSDEVSLLGSYINRMAITIDGQVQALETKDQKRRELIANVSHDLRGPVGVLSLATSSLEAAPEIQRSADLVEQCRMMSSVTDSLKELLLQLFELAKIEARDRPLDIVFFPLMELLEELAERYRARASLDGLTIQVNVATKEENVFCDPRMIERVICNLIENAIAYSNEGGRITLGAEDWSGGVKILVEDTGVGIEAEDLTQVFERRFRGGAKPNQNSTSAGLGLAIVQKIIEAHGTEINVESKVGVGTTFWFVLPVQSGPGTESRQ